MKTIHEILFLKQNHFIKFLKPLIGQPVLISFNQIDNG